MTQSSFLELAIIAFIVVGIGAAIWRGGARNPVNTGRLDRKLTKFGTVLDSVTKKVSEIEDRVEQIEKKAASAEDIKRLEVQIGKVGSALPDMEARQRALADRIGEHAARSAATGAKVDHINRQVDLIYLQLVKKGMEK